MDDLLITFMGHKKLYKQWSFYLFLMIWPTGMSLGIGGFAFYYGQGHAYLTDNPMACMNCHIMKEQFESWSQSSHHHVAVCNDCHTPSNIIGKYSTKAINGWEHSYAFTSGHFQWPIQIKNRSKRIVENNCKRCHEQLIDQTAHTHLAQEEVNCLHCHKNIGHSR